jgi:hypothetical protein
MIVAPAVVGALAWIGGAFASVSVEPPRKLELREDAGRVEVTVSCASPDGLGYLFASVAQERNGVSQASDTEKSLTCDGSVRRETISFGVSGLRPGRASLTLIVLPNCLSYTTGCSGYEQMQEDVVLVPSHGR